jgi:hypothetical protein
MQIGAQGGWQNAGCEHRARIVEAEMRTTSYVDGDPFLKYFKDQRVDCPVSTNEVRGIAGERMGQHVACLEQWHNLFDDGVRIDADAGHLRPQRAEMHIDRQAKLPPRLLGELQRFKAPA